LRRRRMMRMRRRRRSKNVKPINRCSLNQACDSIR